MRDAQIRGKYDTAGPFEPWESDHTALVHVLWDAKRRGLTLDDADEIAGLIRQSRWMAAAEADAASRAKVD